MGPTDGLQVVTHALLHRIVRSEHWPDHRGDQVQTHDSHSDPALWELHDAAQPHRQEHHVDCALASRIRGSIHMTVRSTTALIPTKIKAKSKIRPCTIG